MDALEGNKFLLNNGFFAKNLFGSRATRQVPTARMSSTAPLDLKQFHSAQKNCRDRALEFVEQMLEKGPPEGWANVWSTEERKLRTVYKCSFVADWPRAKAARVFDMIEGILYSSGFWMLGKMAFRSGKKNQNTITYDWECVERMTHEQFQEEIVAQTADEEVDVKDRMIEEAAKLLNEAAGFRQSAKDAYAEARKWQEKWTEVCAERNKLQADLERLEAQKKILTACLKQEKGANVKHLLDLKKTREALNVAHEELLCSRLGSDSE
jgi:hypothetical protein